MEEWQRAEEPLIALVTALPKEFAAVYALVDSPRDIDIAGHRATLATIGASGGAYSVLLPPPLPQMGNNQSAIRVTNLLTQIPALAGILMVGIAGGVPKPGDAESHVRLGDIVVSGPEGVVQYDFGKAETDRFVPRHPPRAPGAAFLTAVRTLEANEYRQERPWEELIARGLQKLGWERPSEQTDKLANSDDPTEFIAHPPDSQRRPGQPRVFAGPIAAANVLLKDATRRDALRDQFGVKAVEMEGSGIADATWAAEQPYLIVRGICDYCDTRKNDTWQEYAALVAAAYACAVVATLPIASQSQRYRATATIDDTWWQDFEQIASKLYPLGPIDQQIWPRGGGDLAALRLGDTGRAAWFAAMRTLRQGGGGTTPAALLGAIAADFPQHPALARLIAALG